VVTICTAQWSLYVPHSVIYMHRTVVTICTAQWSLYKPHSVIYMYRTVVTICTAQWSLYVPHSGHYMYRTVLSICTARFNFHKSYFLPTQSICVFCVDLRTNSDYTGQQISKHFFVSVDGYVINLLFSSMKLEKGHKNYLALVLKLCYTVIF